MRNPGLERVLRAERAPTGRARCRVCRELIEKGALRVAVLPEIEEDAGPMVPTQYVHASCAPAHVGGEGLLSKLLRVSPDLGAEERSDLAAALG